MCFSISKPGGVWQLDETMMADGCIFREGRTQLPPVMQSDRPRLEMIIFYNFTRVVGSQALSYHTSNWETARPPQTLVSCEREKNSTISQLVLAKIWLICNTKCWQYKNNKALPVLSQPITNGTNTFLQRKHQLNTPLLFQTLFYCCFSGWRDMFCSTSSHPSLVFCVNPPLL